MNIIKYYEFHYVWIRPTILSTFTNNTARQKQNPEAREDEKQKSSHEAKPCIHGCKRIYMVTKLREHSAFQMCLRKEIDTNKGILKEFLPHISNNTASVRPY